MAKWEAVDSTGTSYNGDGKPALAALVAEGKLQNGDGLFDEGRKSWTTVGKYLGVPAKAPAAAVAGPGTEMDGPGIKLPPMSKGKQLGIAVGVLAVVIGGYFLLRDKQAPPPVVTSTQDALPATAGVRGDEPEGDRREGGERAAVLTVGEEYNVRIESVGSRGDGMTRIKGMVVFVAETREGEEARVRITRLSRSTAQAEKIGPATGPVEVSAAPSGGDRQQTEGGDRSRPVPVEVGKEYDVTISEVGSRGDGIARLEGFVIFVPGTQAGQAVKVRVTRVGRSSAQAEVVR